MKRRSWMSTAVFVLIFGACGLASAHTPICACYDAGDGSIACEGGFSDGSSAAGVEMRVVEQGGKVLVSGKMDELSEFTFKKPQGPYTVIFDAGPGHRIEIKANEITE